MVMVVKEIHDCSMCSRHPRARCYERPSWEPMHNSGPRLRCSVRSPSWPPVTCLSTEVPASALFVDESSSQRRIRPSIAHPSADGPHKNEASDVEREKMAHE